MTIKQFEQQMLTQVLYYKDKLENAELRRAMMPKGIVDYDNLTFNPFLKFYPKYFNIKILSNLQGLYSVMCNNPELKPYEINLFIISNPKFKVLNQLINFNPYFVTELKQGIHSPMDIAISYATYCQTQSNHKNMPKR